MENNPNTEAQELKTAIDASIENKATEVKTDLKAELEGKASTEDVATLKNENETLQKQLDDVKAEVKNFNITKNMKTGSELSELLKEKASAIKNMKNGDKVSLDLKDFTGSAGAASAPYGDERVTDIKYDPNFQNRIRQHLVTGSTSSTGAVRHTFETAETDSSAPKTKGAAQTQSAVTLTDVHTPIQTLYNVLTLPQEWLDDVAMIESYLSTRLMANLMDVEDVQLLRGNGTSPNYSGLATGKKAFADNTAFEAYLGDFADSQASAANVNRYDSITAVAAAMANENFMADKAFINPIDYYLMVTNKSSQDGHYTLQSTVAPNGEYKTIWNGIELIKCASQTAGHLTMIDSKQATQYWLRDGASIEFGMNDDDFASNNISVRASIRGALTNYKANGIISENFSAIATAIGVAA